MATETELKFRIPAAQLEAVRRAVATRSAQLQPLAAVYFDTPGHQLASARVALRLRDEGSGWVQTLKAEGSGALQRLEHNAVLPAGPLPTLDLSRHDGHPAAALLRKALGREAASSLRERYRTEVRRTLRRLRSDGAVLELALDEGWIEAGGRRLALCELEIELISGSPQALLAVAARWAQRFGLLLDVRSKSERGHLLADGRLLGPPAAARALRLAPDSPWAQARAAMLANPLRQVLANASMIALAEDDGAVPEPEHLHQLRVGLRRLRSVLATAWPEAAQALRTARAAERSALPGEPADAQPPLGDTAATLAAAATLFAALGAARDQDVLSAWLWPALQADAAPPELGPLLAADAAAQPPAAPATLLRRPGTQLLWLRLLALAQPEPEHEAAEPAAPAPPAAAPGALAGSASPTSPASAALPAAPAAPAAPAPPGPSARDVLAPVLQRLLRQLRRDALHVAQLDDAARHRLRRRIKRLRYLAELSAGLWPRRRLKRLLAELKAAQEPLGVLNDGSVALARCQALAASAPQAWFAVGWLRARQALLLPLCAKALARVAACGSPFRATPGQAEAGRDG